MPVANEGVISGKVDIWSDPRVKAIDFIKVKEVIHGNAFSVSYKGN